MARVGRYQEESTPVEVSISEIAVHIGSVVFSRIIRRIRFLSDMKKGTKGPTVIIL